MYAARSVLLGAIACRLNLNIRVDTQQLDSIAAFPPSSGAPHSFCS